MEDQKSNKNDLEKKLIESNQSLSGRNDTKRRRILSSITCNVFDQKTPTCDKNNKKLMEFSL